MPLTIGPPVDIGALRARIDAILHRRPGAPRDTLIQNPGPTPDWSDALAAIAAARAHFNALPFWKKSRWTICAYRKGIATDPQTGHAGWSGMSLYVMLFFEQQIVIPGHPISPCSRRMTSASASPWDYTP